MSDIKRLIRVADNRNRAEEYAEVKFKVLRTLKKSLVVRLADDRISKTAFFEAVVKGYVDRHPAVMAMVDQWIRENTPEGREPRSPSLRRSEIDEIYAEISRGNAELSEEDPS